jgi:hypothetical protein
VLPAPLDKLRARCSANDLLVNNQLCIFSKTQLFRESKGLPNALKMSWEYTNGENDQREIQTIPLYTRTTQFNLGCESALSQQICVPSRNPLDFFAPNSVSFILCYVYSFAC